jgi:hypothetical protein
VEVKSTFSVKPQFIPDVALQLFVARASGVAVHRAEVMHLDPSCRDASGDERRFVRADVTAAAEALQPAIPARLAAMSAALGGALPDVAPGERCDIPYVCPFLSRCRVAPDARVSAPQ